jgi:hypothetical protein
LRWSLAGGEGEEWSGGKFESASIAAALAAGASLEGRAGGSEGERRASREGYCWLAPRSSLAGETYRRPPSPSIQMSVGGREKKASQSREAVRGGWSPAGLVGRSAGGQVVRPTGPQAPSRPWAPSRPTRSRRHPPTDRPDSQEGDGWTYTRPSSCLPGRAACRARAGPGCGRARKYRGATSWTERGIGRGAAEGEKAKIRTLDRRLLDSSVLPVSLRERTGERLGDGSLGGRGGDGEGQERAGRGAQPPVRPKSGQRKRRCNLPGRAGPTRWRPRSPRIKPVGPSSCSPLSHVGQLGRVRIERVARMQAGCSTADPD